MRSPSPQPANGSSRAEGGILRGRQFKYAHADKDDETQQSIKVTGCVRLFMNSDRPQKTQISQKPDAIVRTPVYNTFASLLPLVGKRNPSIKGMSDHIFYIIFVT